MMRMMRAQNNTLGMGHPSNIRDNNSCTWKIPPLLGSTLPHDLLLSGTSITFWRHSKVFQYSGSHRIFHRPLSRSQVCTPVVDHQQNPQSKHKNSRLRNACLHPWCILHPCLVLFGFINEWIDIINFKMPIYKHTHHILNIQHLEIRLIMSNLGYLWR